jgi:hypothetical protein
MGVVMKNMRVTTKNRWQSAREVDWEIVTVRRKERKERKEGRQPERNVIVLVLVSSSMF